MQPSSQIRQPSQYVDARARQHDDVEFQSARGGGGGGGDGGGGDAASANTALKILSEYQIRWKKRVAGDSVAVVVAAVAVAAVVVVVV